MKRLRQFCLAGAALLMQECALAQQESLQPQSPLPLQELDRPPAFGVEIAARYDKVSGGFGDWRDVSVRGSAQLGDHLLQAELASQRHFRAHGNFAGLSDTYTFSPDWYGSLALGAGDGVFFLPRYRIDAFLNKKWLAKKNLVTFAGAGRYEAPDGHVDRSVSLGLIAYFDIPLVAEGGLRRNVSDPGSVSTLQKYVAASYGRHGDYLLIGRHGWGMEGYLPFAPGSSLVGYYSRETSLTWRQWFTRRAGLAIEAHRYENSLFKRRGVVVSVFHAF
jgi:YaiO family outer membrane protein